MTSPEPPPPPPGHGAGAAELASGDLDRSLVAGIAWTSAAKWASQAVTWGATILVARLLRPEDYGLVGMATIYLGLVTVLNEFGFGTAIVTLQSLSREQVSQLNTVALVLGVVTFDLSFAAAPLLSAFFDAPELDAVIVAMSAAFIFGALRTVPQSLLQKELRFRALAVIETAQSVGRALLMVALAFADYGYWTLVWGSVAGEGLWTVLVLISRRHAFAVPRTDSIRHAMTFSWHILVSRLSWYVFSHADFAVAGRVLGKASLGAYSLAWTLASMAVEKVTALVTRVTPAYFAAVQSKPADLRRYLLRLTEGLALVTWPASVGLALVADPLIPFVVGDQWAAAVLPVQLLAISAAFRSVRSLIPQILTVTGRTRFGMWNAVVSAVVLPAAFVAGVQWGTAGLAAAWLVVYPLLSVPIYVVAFREIGLPLRDYLAVLWPAGKSVAWMALAVSAARWLAPAEWHVAVRLGVEVASGVVVYTAVLGLQHRDRFTAFLAMMRRAPTS